MALAASTMVAAADAGPAATSYSVAAEYTTGDYGGDDSVDVWFLPFRVTHERQSVRFEVEVPLIALRGSEDTRLVAGRVDNARKDGIGTIPGGSADGNGSETRTEFGLGDITASGFMVLMPETRYTPLLEIGLAIKLPTASEDDGLGTGETDYKVGMNIVKRGRYWTLFAGLGIKFLGDPPGEDLDDPAFVSLGVAYTLDEANSVGVAWDGAQGSTLDSPDAGELTLHFVHRLAPDRLIKPYLILGTDEGSADYGLGVQYSWRN